MVDNRLNKITLKAVADINENKREEGEAFHTGECQLKHNFIGTQKITSSYEH